MRDHDLEQRFSTLDLLEAPDHWSGIEERADEPTLRPVERSWRPVWAAAAAAAATLLLIGGIELLRGPIAETDPVVTEAPTTTVPTTTAATTSEAPTPPTITTVVPVPVAEVLQVPAALVPDRPQVPATTFDFAQLEWRRVEVPDSLFGEEVPYAARIVALGSRLVVFGREDCDGQRHAAVWISDDGYTWSRVQDDPVFQLTPPDSPQCPLGFRDVVVGGPGVVAVGDTAGPGPAHAFKATVWITPDGLSWSRLSADGDSMAGPTRLQSVYLGGPGIVAIGDTATWTSPDGLTWKRVLDSVPYSSYMEREQVSFLAFVAANENGLVGATPTDNGFDFWASQDGTTWTKRPSEDTSPRPCIQWLGRQLAATDSAFVAVRTCNDGLGAEYSTVWASQNGQSWTTTTFEPGQVIHDVLGTGSSFLGVGGTKGSGSDPSEANYQPTIWTSTDGSTWVPVDLDQAEASRGKIWDVVLGGPGLTAVGVSPDGPTIWVATPSSP